MNKVYKYSSVMILIFIIGCGKKSLAVNIYDSEEYKYEHKTILWGILRHNNGAAAPIVVF